MSSLLDEDRVIAENIYKTYCSNCKNITYWQGKFKSPCKGMNECLKKKSNLIIEARLRLAKCRVIFLNEKDIFTARFSYPRYLEYVKSHSTKTEVR